MAIQMQLLRRGARRRPAPRPDPGAHAPDEQALIERTEAVLSHIDSALHGD